MSLDGHCVAPRSSKTRAAFFPRVQRGRRLSSGGSELTVMTVGRRCSESRASAADGMEARLLRRNKSEGGRGTRGARFYLHCAGRGPETGRKQHLDPVVDVLGERRWRGERRRRRRSSRRPRRAFVGVSRPRPLFLLRLRRAGELVSCRGYFDCRCTLATCLWKQSQSTTWLIVTSAVLGEVSAEVQA